MRINPMDVFWLIIGILIGLVMLWLAIDYTRMIKQHKRWEKELDETDR